MMRTSVRAGAICSARSIIARSAATAMPGTAWLPSSSAASSTTGSARRVDPLVRRAFIEGPPGRSFITVGTQSGFVIGPAALYLDPHLEVNLAVEQFFHV